MILQPGQMLMPASPGGQMMAVPLHQAMGCAVSAQMYPITMTPYQLPVGAVLMQMPGPGAPVTQLPPASMAQGGYKLEMPSSAAQRSASPRWADMGADDP
ncbi:unnamed protein product [Effrenium voratum]|nr:unnamed protein product [Effrenium voratum]